MCALLISTGDVDIFAVQQSLILTKLILTPSSECPSASLKAHWASFPDSFCSQVKSVVLRGLFFPDFVIRSIASIDVALVAAIGPWPDLLTLLESTFSSDQYSVACHIGCLLAVRELVVRGLVTRTTPSVEVVAPTFCEHLAAIISGADLPIAELRELLSVYSSIFDVFGFVWESSDDRSTLISVLRQKFEIPDTRIHFALYDLLFVMFRRFYDDIMPNMEQLFEATIPSLDADDPAYVAPVLDFWHRVTQFERGLDDCHDIVETAADSLLPVLLSCVTQIPEDEVHIDVFNQIDVPNLARKCLRGISALAPERTFAFVAERCLAMLTAAEWRDRAGGLLGLSAVMKGPNRATKCEFFMAQFPILMALTTDDSVVVSSTAVFVIARAVAHFHEFLEEQAIAQEVLYLCVAWAPPAWLFVHRGVSLIEAVVKWGKIASDVFQGLFDYLGGLAFQDGFEMPKFLLQNITDSFAALIRATPEGWEELPNFLNAILAHVQQLGASLDHSENRLCVCARISLDCVLIHSIATELGSDLDEQLCNECLEVIMKVLQLPDCLEDGLIAAIAVVRLSEAVLPFRLQILGLLGELQKSESPSLIALSAVCLQKLWGEIGAELANRRGEFIALLLGNLDNEMLPLHAKTSVVGAISAMLNLEYCVPFLEQLNRISRVPLRVRTSENDREVAPLLYGALVNGYHTVMYLTKETDLVGRLLTDCKRTVAGLFRQMSGNDEFDELLMMQIVKFLRLCLDLYPNKLNVFLRRQDVGNILGIGYNELDIEECRFLAKRISLL
jgi:hypothetical protein